MRASLFLHVPIRQIAVKIQAAVRQNVNGLTAVSGPGYSKTLVVNARKIGGRMAPPQILA
jgi:hypothetical protein